MQYDPAGVATAQGIWVGDVNGSCGPGVCGMHLAVPFPMVQAGTGPGAEPLYRNLTATPRWSIDGHTVVYGRPPADGSSGGELYLADVGGPGSAAVAAEGRIPVDGVGVSPVFSPVDDRIAFVHPSRTSAWRLDDLLITTRTGEITPLIVDNTIAACAIGGIYWSPDGASIGFNASAKAMRRDDIWAIRVGASKASLVLSTPGAFYWVTGWR